MIRVCVLLFVFVCGNSCVSYEGCLRKYGEMAVDSAVVYDTVISYRPVDSIRFIVHKDSSHVIVRETERTRLMVHKDTIVCSSKADSSLQVNQRVIVKEKILFKDKRITPWWTWALVGAAVSFGLILLIRR